MLAADAHDKQISRRDAPRNDSAYRTSIFHMQLQEISCEKCLITQRIGFGAA